MGNYCADRGVAVCPGSMSGTDLMFILDGSNNMNYANFEELANWALDFYCTIPDYSTVKLGLIASGRNVQIINPLQVYATDADWHEEIAWMLSLAQENYFVDQIACCECCSPWADAFLLAKTEFQAKSTSAKKKLVVLSAGLPLNNALGANGGNPDWLFKSSSAGYDPAQYAVQDFPNTAAELRNSLGVDIIYVGGPSISPMVGSNDASRFDFVRGTAGIAQYCITRDGKQFCAPYNVTSKFPIASEPQAKNMMITTTWTRKSSPAYSRVMNMFCLVPPTPAPKPGVTNAPVVQVTAAPNSLPTMPVPDVDWASTNCVPGVGKNKAECLKTAKRCSGVAPMVWTGGGCKLNGLRMQDAGCQCASYCGFSCEKACTSGPNRDRCMWEDDVCKVRATGEVGTRVPKCVLRS